MVKSRDSIDVPEAFPHILKTYAKGKFGLLKKNEKT